MAEKITYILGAGASIGAFPLVNPTDQWQKRGLADTLLVEGQRLSDSSLLLANDNNPTQKLIAQAMTDTGRNAKTFGNVDTYAKYLYHKRLEDQLGKLKLALTYYFSYRQLCSSNTITENRYTNFVTSLLTDRGQFPDHVKVLNWNYDYLLETANALYLDEDFTTTGSGFRHSGPFVPYFPKLGFTHISTHKEFANEDFSIVHLNGIAGFYIANSPNHNPVIHSIFNDLQAHYPSGKITEKNLLHEFHKKYAQNPHLITFAWEKTSDTKPFLVNTAKITENITKGTTIIVVIGYSFPFYNRDIDNMIFKSAKKTLQKIYYQDPRIDGEFLRNRYNLDYAFEEDTYPEIPIENNVDIEHITDTDQFYIPVEV